MYSICLQDRVRAHVTWNIFFTFGSSSKTLGTCVACCGTRRRNNAVRREKRARRGTYNGALRGNDGGAVCARIAGVCHPFEAPGKRFVISTFQRNRPPHASQCASATLTPTSYVLRTLLHTHVDSCSSRHSFLRPAVMNAIPQASVQGVERPEEAAPFHSPDGRPGVLGNAVSRAIRSLAYTGSSLAKCLRQTGRSLSAGTKHDGSAFFRARPAHPSADAQMN